MTDTMTPAEVAVQILEDWTIKLDNGATTPGRLLDALAMVADAHPATEHEDLEDAAWYAFDTLRHDPNATRWQRMVARDHYRHIVAGI